MVKFQPHKKNSIVHIVNKDIYHRASKHR